MLDAVKALVASRKFLITMLAVAACTVLVAIGKIAPETFVVAVSSLAAVLTAAIAHEDAAEKSKPDTATLTQIAGNVDTLDTTVKK